MDNEIDCSKCRKCGQQMQDEMIIDTWKSFAICKCENPNCIRNCILKKQISVMNSKKCPGCGNEKIEYFGKDNACRIYWCHRCTKLFEMTVS